MNPAIFRRRSQLYRVLQSTEKWTFYSTVCYYYYYSQFVQYSIENPSKHWVSIKSASTLICRLLLEDRGAYHDLAQAAAFLKGWRCSGWIRLGGKSTVTCNSYSFYHDNTSGHLRFFSLTRLLMSESSLFKTSNTFGLFSLNYFHDLSFIIGHM